MKKLLLACAVLVMVAQPAQAATIRAKINNATCKNHGTFTVRFRNDTNRAAHYTIVLWHGHGVGKPFFLRDEVPAHGTGWAWVRPDYSGEQKAYSITVFQSYQWHPHNAAWVRTHYLADGYGDLGRCA